MGASYMQTTTLMIDLNIKEIEGLLSLCRQGNRASLRALCDSKEQAEAMISALDEITWQLASSGHEGAIETLSTLVVGWPTNKS